MLASGLPSCRFEPSGWSPGIVDYLPRCGGDLGGVTLDLAKGLTTPALIKVGERLVVTANVGRPFNTYTPTPECPSQLGGQPFFTRVEWSWSVGADSDVTMLSCPCTPDYVRDAYGWRHVASTAHAFGDYKFEIVGRSPGPLHCFSVSAYLSGPCGGRAPGDTIVECGPSAMEIDCFRVVE